ncbi:MAG: beta-hydroxylase [Planctomycetes bacterium]|nr:beta-hydroxylase [Planctomycetota bacterium]
MTAYLLDLNERLGRAASAWPPRQREPFVRFVRGAWAGAGFRGRAGGADLYYTAFALRALAMLGDDLDDLRAPLLPAAATTGRTSLADRVSALFTVRLLSGAGAPPPPAEAHAAAFEALRCDDGGYARAPGGASSTYATFLVAVGYDLLGASPPDAGGIAAFVRRRRRDDGGFADADRMPRSSVNPTAAAVALAAAGGLDDAALYDGAARFLLDVQRGDGGFPAGRGAPTGDLLSTFTALLTLSDLGAADAADTAAAERFTRACRAGEGGFGGVPGDDGADVEYTFYGLGVLAVLGAAP